MSSICDNHNRVRVHQDVWDDITQLKKAIGLTITTPALANDLMRLGIKNYPKPGKCKRKK